MFENFYEALFNLRILLENISNFKTFLENLIIILVLFGLTKLFFHRPIFISEINIKCKSISTTPMAVPPVPSHLGLWGACAPIHGTPWSECTPIYYLW